ncbi:nitrate- and nitrite sensing domain-containing protein [Aromatoleum toluolicum]|uniref:Nitrate/nitrite sensing protein domain-containing protein n=1 Tax=Aromatoleum toluolicum TaxID=90060 RepID=A0ABX1NDS0_9RHOO|nr:nitrate- and nitrite sensing domain-containing protein [Aromatoleum toluolicum]NMF97425.1 nitrate- and nitrite sensing domain-containing protein [Aromatoleum toluolicum]
MENTIWRATATAAALGLAYVAVRWGGLRRHAGKRVPRARQALATGGKLVQLIAHVQQHRGMSNAWRAGDASFAARLPEKQSAIERLFGELLADAVHEDAAVVPCFVSHDVRRLRHLWQDVVRGLGRATPEENFAVHCRIIADLLDWLGALGEARIEQPLAGLVPAVAARNFAHRLPALAECLGQARALASAVAARRECPPVSRVRLLFLLSRAESLLAQVVKASGGSGAGSTDAGRAVDRFVAALRDRLLASGDIQLTAGECFTLGTAAIDRVFELLGAECALVEASLARARAGLADVRAGGVAA